MTGHWGDDARCREVGPELFFSDDDGNALRQAQKQAKEICARCPVRRACLEYALAFEGAAHNNMRAGIWGGYNATQRARIARKRGMKRPGNPHKAAVLDLNRIGLDRAAIARRLEIDHRTVRDILRSQKLAA